MYTLLRKKGLKNFACGLSIKSVHAKHVRDGFESLLTFEAKSGDFAVPCDNLCVHTIKIGADKMSAPK